VEREPNRNITREGGIPDGNHITGHRRSVISITSFNGSEDSDRPDGPVTPVRLDGFDSFDSPDSSESSERSGRSESSESDESLESSDSLDSDSDDRTGDLGSNSAGSFAAASDLEAHQNSRGETSTTYAVHDNRQRVVFGDDGLQLT
jgi:hypothetical protein